MDVQAKINCSLDDLIKYQRKAPRGQAAGGPAASTPQKRAAPQRVNNKVGINKKPQKPGRQQQPYIPRQQQKQQGNFARQQQHRPFNKQHQQNRTPSVADKISLPLDAVIAKQHQQQKRQQQQQLQRKQQEQQQHQQQQQGRQKGGFAVTKKQQVSSGRRGGFLASRDAQRRGRLSAFVAAARSAARSAAAKSLEAGRIRGGRVRTPHQQVVETLKSAAAFKAPGARLNRRNNASTRERAKAGRGAAGNRRFGNGRLSVRRLSVAGAALPGASRTNISLARRRPLGSAAPRRNTNVASAARSSGPYPTRKDYAAPAPTVARPIPIDRRRPPSPPPAPAPSFATDPEMLANIKIMATLDTVPAPLPQQRGTHVAVPAAMQQQQHEQQQQQPSRAGGNVSADTGTLSSRFGY